MAPAKATLEKVRKELGFDQVGMANGIPVFVSTERSNALQSQQRLAEPKLALASYHLLLAGFSSDSSFAAKFNDSGKTDTNFWIAGIGKDINHLVAESQVPEITDAQETEALKLAESGLNYKEIAQKLDIPSVGVYYALKRKGAKRKPAAKKPRTSALFTFEKTGNLIQGKGGSLETTVRVSRGEDDGPLLFFILRDSYSRVGGARFVIAACNGRQFTADFVARMVLGVPQEAGLK